MVNEAPMMIDEVERAIEACQFIPTHRTKKITEFRSKVNGQYIYFEKRTGLPSYVHLVTDPRLEPRRVLDDAYKHSNMTRFPKYRFGGQNPIHYGFDHKLNSVADLVRFLESANANKGGE
jgi:hypothetical protein